MGGWTLTEVRQGIELTQTEVAGRFGTTQSGISRIERQDDWLVSTLVDYAAALGGSVSVTLHLPNGDHAEMMLPAPVIGPYRQGGA